MSKDTSVTQPRERGRFVKTEKIDFDAAVKLLEFAVKGREDYVYDDRDNVNRCQNWNVLKDQPSCLIGTVLYDWGVPKVELIMKNTLGSNVFRDFYADERVKSLFDVVQEYQDAGVPWGDCVDRALHRGKYDVSTI